MIDWNAKIEEDGYCDNCGRLETLFRNRKVEGNLCDGCHRLGGRTKFTVNAWKRTDHDIDPFEPLVQSTRKFLVAFDVDDTLFDHSKGRPDEDVINLLMAFSAMTNAKVMVWSAGGREYATRAGRAMGLHEFADVYEGKQTYQGPPPDLFIDDNGIGVPSGRAWLYVGDEEQR